MNVCVFCGSGEGHDPEYGNAAAGVGRFLAENGHELIYGGGRVGLMGILADSVLDHHGRVTGVIPGFLVEKEVGHKGLSRLEIVGSMHERKKRMADLADVFVVLPGGLGTLDETAEILTWRQLALTKEPLGLLNVNRFFDPLLRLFEHMKREGFLKATDAAQIVVESTIEALFAALQGHFPPPGKG